jgi:hypothetical protein
MPQKRKLGIYPLKLSQILKIGGFDPSHFLKTSALRLAWWVLRQIHDANQLSDIYQGNDMISGSFGEKFSMPRFSNSVPCHGSPVAPHIIFFSPPMVSFSYFRINIYFFASLFLNLYEVISQNSAIQVPSNSAFSQRVGTRINCLYWFFAQSEEFEICRYW